MIHMSVKNGFAIGITLLFLTSSVLGNVNVNENEVLTNTSEFSTENYQTKNMQYQITVKDLNDKGKVCYGYQAYPNPDLIIWFDLDNPGTLNTINTSISLDKISGGTWVDGVWWCCEYTPTSNSNIWIIDYVTGNMILVGTSNSFESLHGLAYDDSTGTMYACGATCLFTINMTTGAATLVGPFGFSGSVMIGIACDGYGNMYAEDLHTDSLYSIDPSTGLATLIGPFGLDLNYGQDMAFDKEEGVCYLSAFTVHAGNEGALYICNLSTGATTKIGNLGTEPTQITGFVIPYNLNDLPNAPIIDGPNSGKLGIEYEYNFSLSDPDNDSMRLRVDWGSGIPSKWYGPYTSGTKLKLNHTWNKKRTFTIKAQAKDIFDAESEWSEFKVTIPRNKATTYSLFSWFFERFLLLERLLTLFR